MPERSGAWIVEMQQAGRWLSLAMRGLYVRRQLTARGPVARLDAGATAELRPDNVL